MFSTMPPNPMNANEIKEAAINVTANPLNGAGILLSSIRERNPENSTIARRKPRPQPSEFTIDSAKVKLSSIFSMVTPKTAQFVVISGR